MELLKVNEFANRFNLSISKVRAMCQTGELPACKIGVGWRIDVEKAERVLSILFDRKTPQKRNFSTTRAYALGMLVDKGVTTNEIAKTL